jgi:hypothetical protein
LFQDVGVLIGHWLPYGSDMEWKFGGWLRIDHNKSTGRVIGINNSPGEDQCRFAMVSRELNLARLELPCYV